MSTKTKKTSRIPAFYKKSYNERLFALKHFANLTENDLRTLKNHTNLDITIANKIIENVVGLMSVPMGIATNFLINGKDYLIPMATEEPSVIAAACHAAKLARKTGGFSTQASDSIMTGQIQLVNIPNISHAQKTITKHKQIILEQANTCDKLLIQLGGGAQNIQVKELETPRGTMLIVHLDVDVQDAMGSNIVNTMLETIAPTLERLTNSTTRLKIVSNLSDKRIIQAHATWSQKTLSKKTIEAILDAHTFACFDPYRAVTHNKGVMNGIDAVALATGNDIRAIEASAHGFASASGKYKPLTTYTTNKTGDLVGTIKIPLAVGIVGGITKTHPMAKLALKILGVASAQELARVMATVGLAQNFAALKALVTEGIQRGHMALHSKNIAIQAGAKEQEIDHIAHIMIKEKNISVSRAQELLTMS